MPYDTYPPTPLDADELFSHHYKEIYKRARQCLRGFEGQTLGATALINEAYVRLTRNGKPKWHSRDEFFRVISRAMHNALMDYRRAKLTKRRGGDKIRVAIDHNQTLPGVVAASDGSDVNQTRPDVVAPDDGDYADKLKLALERMLPDFPEHAELILLYLAGCKMAEIAKIQGISLGGAENRWRCAKANLKRYMDYAARTMPSRKVNQS